MYTLQANPTGTRNIEVSEEHLSTLKRYHLLNNLIDSNGVIDEDTLEKLRLNIRSLIATQESECKDLLDLCIDVIYHNNMKAFGLQQLLSLYHRKAIGNTEGEFPMEIAQLSETEIKS